MVFPHANVSVTPKISAAHVLCLAETMRSRMELATPCLSDHAVQAMNPTAAGERLVMLAGGLQLCV